MNTACFLSIPAMMFPEQEMLVFGETRFTYGQLQERVSRLSHGLRSLGLTRGSRLGVLHTNCSQYVEAYFATSKMGGTFVPLNYRAKANELANMIRAAQVDALLVGERYVDAVLSLRADIPSVRHWISLEKRAKPWLFYDDLLVVPPGEDFEEDMEGDETNILMFTSGTTALPKGVMLSYEDFVGYVFGTVEPADGQGKGATLLCAPLYHIAGMSAIMASVYGGRRLVLMPQFEAGEWIHLVGRERITNAFLVPTMMKRLLDEPGLETADLSSLETISYGAAPMPLSVIRRAIERFPTHVGFVNAFGQTETTATVTMLTPEDHRLEGSPEEIEKKLKRLASIGRPLPDVQVRIVDDVGREAPRGELGEVCVKTSRLMKGYAGQEELTKAVIVDSWMRTSDLGWMDEDGYVYLAGRKDDLIIRGGENIAPVEIEAVLHSHPAIAEAAVIGHPDEEWGEKVLAVVVLRAGATATPDEIQDYCRGRLASFKNPAIIEFTDGLPVNALGKVLKKELKARYNPRV